MGSALQQNVYFYASEASLSPMWQGVLR